MTYTRRDTYTSPFVYPDGYPVSLGVGTYQLTPNYLQVSPNTCMLIEMRATLFRSGGSDAGMFWRAAVVKLDAAGASPTIMSTYSVIPDTLDANLLGSTIYFEPQTDAINIQYHHLSASAYYMHFFIQADIMGDVT